MYLPGIYIPIYQYIETLHNFVQYTIISPQLLCSRSYLPLGTDTLSSFDLQREARRHFGCSTLNGLELENLGGPATRYLHWKKRIIEVSTTYVRTCIVDMWTHTQPLRMFWLKTCLFHCCPMHVIRCLGDVVHKCYNHVLSSASAGLSCHVYFYHFSACMLELIEWMMLWTCAAWSLCNQMAIW